MQTESLRRALPDLGIRPVHRTDLACLRPEEIGDPRYTLEGWLEQIQA